MTYDNHRWPEPPESTRLVLPTHITFQAATLTKSAYLCAYCNAPEQVVRVIQCKVQQLGGVSVCQSVESTGSQRLRIGARLPGLASTDLWKIRAAIQSAGGIVETARVNYQIRRPLSRPAQRPSACVGCGYYYGKSHSNTQLVCAMHPYGPSGDACQDWSGTDSDRGLS